MKKQDESAILRTVYNVEEYAEVIPGEQPDFRLRKIGSEHFFGVEVTEFFFNESSARTAKIKGYSRDLLAGGPHRHKDDIETLKVVEVKFEGVVTQGILTKMPAVQDYVEALRDCIERKNTRLDGYDPTLSYVNLLVLDRVHRLSTMDTPQFHRHVITASLRRSVAQSRYREIILVTELDEEKQVYFPLKMVTLLAEYILYDAAAKTFPHKLDFTDSSERLCLFANVLRRTEFPVAVIEDQEGPAIQLGGAFA